ncbi:hypothetical protein FGSG_12350 [Fusarium graminearum PH-1]|uniref:Chromosome 2, complete genome n=2 Tax=Gibberella zeae TaxID=5518 RepID=I1S679_GIBZE|nr:hypothetical protein FGSG_12350 [Fusarium graminearum PH-1]ESU09241.1 hypothetical protein FGSG_12350 [Fusarium graminearum PH-1]CEF78829.1 unnamed protein product [Fusarium graminearum]|eukprot:XP_011321740.1 hypothetical protein FGSG_12350 [Fusarium graminearum PH-1]
MAFPLEQMYRRDLHPVNEIKIQNGIFSTGQTVAQIWDMNVLGFQDEILDHDTLKSRLAKLESFWNTPDKTKESFGGCRKFILVTTIGDPTTAWRALQLRMDALGCIVDMAKFNQAQSQRLFTTWLPSISTYIQYDDDDTTPTHLNIVFRCPKNSNSLICSMRIHLASLDCFVFMSAVYANDAKDIRSRCIANIDLLRVHPLYFLSIVYENRYERWTNWIAKIWNEVALIETVTNMTHPDWRAGSVQSHEVRSLSTVESFLHQLHATNLELCHSRTVMSYAFRFGNRCLEIINEMDEMRRGLGMTSLSPRQSSEMKDNLEAILERLTSLSDRISELKQRLSSQITASSSLIAQKDSRVNLAIAGLQANDSRTLKGIAILTLLFLPSTLVASNRGQTLWTTNLFKFQGATNWKVYISITAVLTFLVISCSWFYTRLFQRRDNDRWARFAAYDLGFNANSKPM